MNSNTLLGHGSLRLTVRCSHLPEIHDPKSEWIRDIYTWHKVLIMDPINDYFSNITHKNTYFRSRSARIKTAYFVALEVDLAG